LLELQSDLEDYQSTLQLISDCIIKNIECVDLFQVISNERNRIKHILFILPYVQGITEKLRKEIAKTKIFDLEDALNIERII